MSINVLNQTILANLIFFGSIIIADIEEKDPKFRKLRKMKREDLIIVFSNYCEEEAEKIAKNLAESEEEIQNFDDIINEKVEYILEEIILSYVLPEQLNFI
jgi:hypothetical protein